ncbi:TetR/AcrR family transcriptional regulator [Rhodococcus sp. UNC23MFCrub1.1]|uniref:TetR/AcrR family transcriptional regulator n=1 Tax=Rhodococcus sp. UNC23MFCrub1.1 TaxID=1449068 RepID=UPI001E4897B8|nr:TetR/AcrR family transcriptional regulator [Rhodococcus sp. UNC23MFCrub1.1]
MPDEMTPPAVAAPEHFPYRTATTIATVTGQGASTIDSTMSPVPSTDSFRQQALTEFARQFDTAHRDDMSPAKRRVVEAFLKLCVIHGMASVSMRTLAKELEIKAPSIYTHFPGGRDEIITESLRWHFHQFCGALVDAVVRAPDAQSFWDAMVRLHFTRQVRLPESNLWDLIVATDRTAHILPTELSEKVTHWVDLYESLYVAAARDMGIENSERRVKIVNTLLEGATRWFGTDGTDDEVRQGADQAVLMSRDILALPIT